MQRLQSQEARLSQRKNTGERIFQIVSYSVEITGSRALWLGYEHFEK